jgi:hypothetical protein
MSDFRLVKKGITEWRSSNAKVDMLGLLGIGQLYGVHHGILQVFIIMLFKNGFFGTHFSLYSEQSTLIHL